jgi:Lipopolysaccharide biosynthesis proteins, LPS:glycosyltransferases
MLTDLPNGISGSSGSTLRKQHTRLALLTVGIGSKAQKLLEISRPGFQDYARKVGADYHEISETAFPDEPRMVHFNKFKIRELLEHYERVLYVDSDVIISPETPDLFQIVPETHLGAKIEPLLPDQNDPVVAAQSLWGPIPGWKNDHFNSGLLLVSRAQGHLLEPVDQRTQATSPNQTKHNGPFSDELYLNWKLRKLDLPLFELDPFFHWSPGNGESVTGRHIAPGAWIVHFCYEGYEYTRSSTDDFSTYKYHQMFCWKERMNGRNIQRIHPNQFYLDHGSLDLKAFPIRLQSGKTGEGLRVCYGPYRSMEDGSYRFTIRPRFDLSTSESGFRIALCAQRGKRWLMNGLIDADPGTQTFCVDLDGVQDLEVCFYAGAVPYSIECVEIEKLS